MKNNNDFIARAVELSAEGISGGGGPFGAVITKDGVLIAESFNRVVLNHDPTAHAEVNAIRIAGEALGTHDLSGCVLYASCEPCPMCLGAIYWSGIREVYFACTRKDAEEAGFRDNLFYEEFAGENDARSVKLIQVDNGTGREVLKRWAVLDSKTAY